jgi:hypothetical protein
MKVYKCDFCNKTIKNFSSDNYGLFEGNEYDICGTCMDIIHTGIGKILKKLKKERG